MKKKCFAGLIMMMIIHSMISSSYAQSTLNVKAIIEGYYRFNTQTMIPVIDTISSPLLCDTLAIELHSVIDGNLVFSEMKVFDIYGNASVTLPAQLYNNSYYLVLKHRNSLETWSSVPILIGSTANYDFTTALNKAYGNNLVLDNNVACIYSGDINRDGLIDGADKAMLNTAMGNFMFGYQQCDINGDSNVDLADVPFVDNNWFLGVHVISPIFVFTNEFEKTSKVIIKPNPADRNFTLELQNTGEGKLTIIQQDGKLIECKTINQERSNIDISNYPSGIYILKYDTGSEIVTKKLVVKH